MRPEFDEKDEQLRQARIEARQALRGPLVGDLVSDFKTLDLPLEARS